MRKVYLSCLTAFCLMIPVFAYANNIHPIKAAPSFDDYIGVWVAESIEFNGVSSEYYTATGQMAQMLIYPTRGLFVIDNTVSYINYKGIENGCLIFYDQSGTFYLNLTQDGYVTYTVNNIALYFKKQEPIAFNNVSYKALARNPENYYGQYAQFTGKIFFVSGSRRPDSYYQVLLEVDDNINSLLFVELLNVPTYNLMSQDQVTLSVVLTGQYGLGDNTYVPLAFAFDCDLLE